MMILCYWYRGLELTVRQPPNYRSTPSKSTKFLRLSQNNLRSNEFKPASLPLLGCLKDIDLFNNLKLNPSGVKLKARPRFRNCFVISHKYCRRQQIQIVN